MKDKFKVILVVMMFALASVFTVSAAYDDTQKTVKVVKDGQEVEYTTATSTVEQFLTEVGIETEHLNIDAEMNQPINDDDVLNISYDIAVTVIVDNAEEMIIHHEPNTTIKEVVDGIQTENVKYVYELDDTTRKLTEDYTINVKSLKTELFKEIVNTDYEVQEIENDTMYLGEFKIIQEGVPGVQENITEVTFYGKEETSHKQLEPRVIVPATTQIIEIGTKQKVVEKVIDGMEYKDVYTMNASAYTIGYESTGKNPGDRGYGITATGTKAGKGTVAVDPKVIPLGSKVYIPGYGVAIAADTGGAIKGHKIDLCYDSLNEALVFGRRTVTVYVLK